MSHNHQDQKTDQLHCDSVSYWLSTHVQGFVYVTCVCVCILLLTVLAVLVEDLFVFLPPRRLFLLLPRSVWTPLFFRRITASSVNVIVF